MLSSSFSHSGAFSLNRYFLEEEPVEIGLSVGSDLSEGLKCSRGLTVGSGLSEGLKCSRGLTVGSDLSEGLKCSRGLAIGSGLSRDLAVVDEIDGLDLSKEGISLMQTNC
jgi:hypothetical protein